MNIEIVQLCHINNSSRCTGCKKIIHTGESFWKCDEIMEVVSPILSFDNDGATGIYQSAGALTMVAGGIQGITLGGYRGEDENPYVAHVCKTCAPTEEKASDVAMVKFTLREL